MDIIPSKIRFHSIKYLGKEKEKEKEQCPFIEKGEILDTHCNAHNATQLVILNMYSFGQQYEEFDTNGGGWVIAVAWAPSGELLAYSSQDSSIHVVNFSQYNAITKSEGSSSKPPRTIIRLVENLPMCSILFYDENRIVAGGYDGKLILLSHKANAADEARRWSVTNKSSEWEIWNSSGLRMNSDGGDKIESETATNNYPSSAIMCVKKSNLRLGSTCDDGQDSSIYASASGVNGSFHFLKLKNGIA